MGPAVVIFGAGGHGKVVADILLATGTNVVGFLDSAKPAGTEVLGLLVLGDETWLDGHSTVGLALGIGDNAMRAAVARRLGAKGRQLVTAVHPRAVVASSAQIGDGVVIGALGVVGAAAIVEVGAIINTAAIVEHDCRVGAFAHLATNVTTGGGCRVGDHTLVGSGATLLPQRSIGARSVLGSQSLVSRDLPDDCVALGIPARVVRSR